MIRAGQGLGKEDMANKPIGGERVGELMYMREHG